MLSGGVGGARMARGLAAALPPEDLTVVVNVGDDDVIYGVHVAADLDTVTYTLAGIEGPEGWGIAGDTFATMGHLDELGVDTTFRLGDQDLATCLARTAALHTGEALSEATRRLTRSLGVEIAVIPATDDPVRTRITTDTGEDLSFQEYFVLRRHGEHVAAVRYDGSTQASPAPGVLEAIHTSDAVVIAPSNPPLSIWPILAVPGVEEAVRVKPVVAVSPLFGGRALKGPADRVMGTLGLPPGNAGIVAAYRGLVSTLVVDVGDADDALDVAIAARDTRIPDLASATRLAHDVLELAS